MNNQQHEDPSAKLRAIKQEIAMAPKPIPTVNGGMRPPDYGSVADAAWATLELREMRERYGDSIWDQAR